MKDNGYDTIDFLDEDLAYEGVNDIKNVDVNKDDHDFYLSNVTSDTMKQFFELQHNYDSCINKLLAKYGLYDGQPQLLFAVKSSKERLTQNKLALLLGLGRASVGTSVKRLENNGFIRRIRDERDSRCIYVELTAKGSEFIRWCEIDLEMLFTTMLENFDPDERIKIPEHFSRINTALKGLKERLNS